MYVKLLAISYYLLFVDSIGADESCGLSNGRGDVQSPRIIQGSPVEANQFPWMVHLMINTTLEGHSSIGSCGASIIKKKYLLSAAHCFSGEVNQIVALIGYHVLAIDQYPEKQTGYELRLAIKRRILHEEFDPRYLRNDIAILELDAPLEFNEKVHAVCLPPPQDPAGAIPDDSGKAIVAGWGLTQVYGTYFMPQVLLAAVVPLMPITKCMRTPMIGPRVNKNNICAGGFGTDACNGDSGGPLMVTINQNGVRRLRQIGIVSAGIGCGSFRGIPAVYTRVASYIEWIQQVTAED